MPSDEIEKLGFIFSQHKTEKDENGDSNRFLSNATDYLNILNPAMLEVWSLLDTIFSFRFDAKPERSITVTETITN